ncbi:MAG TPA: hypothetical protein VNA13_04215 [Xanthomonadales bacterium]|nr:hypothetical protein [Xanthomonadales bacterium]
MAIEFGGNSRQSEGFRARGASSFDTPPAQPSYTYNSRSIRKMQALGLAVEGDFSDNSMHIVHKGDSDFQTVDVKPITIQKGPRVYTVFEPRRV